MNNENIKKFNELVKAHKALAEERHNALLDEELDQINAATGTGTGIFAITCGVTGEYQAKYHPNYFVV